MQQQLDIVPTNGQLYDIEGIWHVFWAGTYSFLDSWATAALRAQIGTQVQVPIHVLEGVALNWAVAQAIKLNPSFEPTRKHARTLTPLPADDTSSIQVWDYYEHIVIVPQLVSDEQVGRVPFNPVTSYAQGGPLLDTYRISTEIAGDGWAALYNDCFDRGTYAKVVMGASRLEAGLRCIVVQSLGKVVSVPAELVDPRIRISLPG